MRHFTTKGRITPLGVFSDAFLGYKMRVDLLTVFFVIFGDFHPWRSVCIDVVSFAALFVTRVVPCRRGRCGGCPRGPTPPLVARGRVVDGANRVLKKEVET
jgi:hypothetical protein